MPQKDIVIRAIEDFRSAQKAALNAYAATTRRAFEAALSVIKSEQPELALEPDYPEDFQRVWKAWLNWGYGRGTKHGGYRFYRALTPPPTEAAVMAGVAQWGAWWRQENTEERLIPHFETWCNKRAWESPPKLKPARPKSALGPTPNYSGEEKLAHASWSAEWTKRFPGKPYPGLNEAMRLITEADKGAA